MGQNGIDLFHRKTLCRIILLLFGWIVNSDVLGQNKNVTDSISTHILNEVIIHDSLDFAVSVAFDGSEYNAVDLVDQIPGMIKLHANNYPLVYRGMSADNLRVERDGVPRIGITGLGYYANDINTDDLSSITIIDGAQRVLYGSGAIGGVIAISSRDPALHQSNQLYYSYGTNASAHSFGGRLSFHNEVNGATVRFRRNTSSNMHYGGGDEASNSATDQNNLSLSTYFKLGKKLKASWNHLFSNGKWQRPQGFQNNPNELRVYKNDHSYQSDLSLQWGKHATYDQKFWILTNAVNQTLNNYNITFDQLNSRESRNYDHFSFGHKFIREKVSGNLIQKIGTDFLFLRQYEARRIEDFVLNRIDQIERQVNREESRTGIFYYTSFSLSERSWMDLSARGDIGTIGEDFAQLKSAVTGAFSFNWQYQDNILSSWTFGRYFRWPTQFETTGEFVGGRGVFVGNPDIAPESSYQLDWKLSVLKGKLRISLNSWLAIFNDRISEVPVSNGEFTFQNIDKARTFGLESILSLSLLKPQMDREATIIHTINLIRGDEITATNIFGSGSPLIGVPPNRTGLRIEYAKSFSKQVVIKSSGGVMYSFPFKRLPDETIRQIWAAQESDAYMLCDAKFEMNYAAKGRNYIVGVRIDNLLDTNYVPFGIRIPGQGRNVQTYIRVNL